MGSGRPDNGTERRLTEPAGQGGGEDEGARPAGNGFWRGRAAGSGVLRIRVVPERPPGDPGPWGGLGAGKERGSRLPRVGLRVAAPGSVPDSGAGDGEAALREGLAPASAGGTGTLGSEEKS